MSCNYMCLQNITRNELALEIDDICTLVEHKISCGRIVCKWEVEMPSGDKFTYENSFSTEDICKEQYMVIIEKDGLRLCTKTFVKPVGDTIKVINENDIKEGLNIEKQNDGEESWYTLISIDYDGKEAKGTIISDSVFDYLESGSRLLGKLYDIGIKLVEVVNE